MRRFGLLSLVLFGASLVALAGCGNPGVKQYGPDNDVYSTDGASGKRGTEELANDGWATLEGRVVYDGAMPGNETINATKDQAVCLCDEAKKRGEDQDQVWIGKKTADGTGVANVVIFLRPPQGKHFKIHDKYKDVAQDKALGKVVLDQPFCAYEPRVLVLYPGYSDGKDVIKSGQVFEVKNSASVSHNTKIKGNPAFNADKDSGVIPSGGMTTFALNPQDTALSVSCDVHPWMRGYAWAFNHPYAARTDEEGKFKIEHVPAGAELEIVVWHEGIKGGFLSAEGFDGRKGKRMTFAKDKSQTLNLKVSR